ncbi:hypothetical protein JCGZ_03606 [Jatropha curcas]|uniref:Uncharacterized protein n=1 Tax=Jatropha curcas TaxID=180498 RepID=A0A067JCS4_JATCU|nr:hypothetical protein JCGZ_03606 [Jatropha curcas]
MHFPTPVPLYFYLLARIDPSREIASRAWHQRPGQRLVRVSPILEPTPVSPVVRSSSSDSASDSDLVEMADNTVNETGFSPAQLRTIIEIIAAAFAQERAHNQTSAGNAVPVENDLIKQFAELKDKVEKMSVAKEKDPVTNFHVVEYVLHPTEGTQFMVGMVQTGSGTEWTQKIPEFEDFLGIGDEASRMVQEQKSKARILQSILAAEDAEEAKRKAKKMTEHEEAKEKAAPEAKEAPNADEVIQAIKDNCNESRRVGSWGESATGRQEWIGRRMKLGF